MSKNISNATVSLQRGYRYRLYPTEEQHIMLTNYCFNANQAFNILVSMNRQQFKLNKDKIALPNKHLNIYSNDILSNQRQYLSATQEDDIIKTILRKRNLHNINTKVLQQTRTLFNSDLHKKLKNIDTLRKEHYDREKKKQLNNKDYHIKKFELFNYKKSGILGYNSFQTTQEQYTLLDTPYPKWKTLRLFNTNIKIEWSRDLISPLKNVTITHEPNGHWYISFSQVLNVNTKMLKNKPQIKVMGLDINISNITLSDGTKFVHDIKNMNILRNNHKLLKLEQKRAKHIEAAKSFKVKAREIQGYITNNIAINKIHKQNTNIKDYELHQLTNNIITHLVKNNVNVLKMEKLDIKNMVSTEQDNKNHIRVGMSKNASKTMRKNILQVSFYKLQQMLCYKCVQIGIDIIFVNSFNTSKKCHNCGHINNYVTIKNKVWTCEKCNSTHDRDYNAAINIEYI